jgi:hypothetical protein
VPWLPVNPVHCVSRAQEPAVTAVPLERQRVATRSTQHHVVQVEYTSLASLGSSSDVRLCAPRVVTVAQEEGGRVMEGPSCGDHQVTAGLRVVITRKD